jgi:hypothetical protein
MNNTLLADERKVLEFDMTLSYDENYYIFTCQDANIMIDDDDGSDEAIMRRK